jgi:outer membrane protein insertion porin family
MENLELRASLGRGIGLVAFLDGGNVWIKADEAKLSDLKFTTGLGLRYDTPVGPVRVDYGHKLQRDEGESSGELHFSIGHAFKIRC